MMMTMCWILPSPLAAARRAGAEGAPPAIAPMPRTMTTATIAGSAGSAGNHLRRRGRSGRVVPRMLRLLSDGRGRVDAGRRSPQARRRCRWPLPSETPTRWKTCAGDDRRGAVAPAGRSAAEAVALHRDRQAVPRQSEHPGGLRLVAVRAPQRLADRRLLGVADQPLEIEIGARVDAGGGGQAAAPHSLRQQADGPRAAG